MRLIASGQANNGCDYHRTKLPLHFLQPHFDNAHFAALEHFPAMLAECDIYYFNRYPTGIGLEEIAALRKKHGFKIVMDLDDYWQLHTKHIAHKVWYEAGHDKTIVEGLRLADVVTTTTARLADKIREYNANVHVLPNAIPFDFGQFTIKTEVDQDPRFVYVAGGSHLHDVAAVRHVFNRLDRDTRLVFGGKDTHPIYKQIENIMSDKGRLALEMLPGQPVEQYMDLYNAGDVAIAPLEDNHFNYHKSPLKVAEAGCKGIPLICSNLPPFSDLPADCPVVVANNVREWIAAIKLLKREVNLRIELGFRLAEWTRTHFNLYKVNEYRLQLLNQLYDKG